MTPQTNIHRLGAGEPQWKGELRTATRYDVLALLSRGDVSDVCLALARGDAGVDKLVATKRLRPEALASAEGAARFLDEARLAARFNHPNLLETYEVVRAGAGWFMAMEFLDGQPLARISSKARPMGGIPLGILLKMFVDALAGLDALHELLDFDGTPLQVVHGNMSPHSLFVCYTGQVKIIDFDRATAHASPARARPKPVGGLDRYAAPECAGAERIDRRADIFTMGSMLEEAAASKHPGCHLDDDNEATLLRRVVGGDLLATYRPGGVMSEGLDRICRRARAVKPASRFGAASEMQAALEELLDGLGPPVTSREVATYISDLFADERVRLRSLLARELARIGHERRSEDSPGTGMRGASVFDAEPLSEISRPLAEFPAPGARLTGPLSSRPGSFFAWLGGIRRWPAALVGCALLIALLRISTFRAPETPRPTKPEPVAPLPTELPSLAPAVTERIEPPLAAEPAPQAAPRSKPRTAPFAPTRTVRIQPKPDPFGI